MIIHKIKLRNSHNMEVSASQQMSRLHDGTVDTSLPLSELLRTIYLPWIFGNG
ncbi:hypothetical protein J6590_065844 [Homalodisca vitripennis]|nr:hypothetical protein J6590_065844 [Homalodisca vitripennis]